MGCLYRLRLYPLNLIPVMRAQGEHNRKPSESPNIIKRGAIIDRAEIIPILPEPGNAGEGKGKKIAG